MKKIVLLFVSLLFTVVVSAQITKTTVPITGLGNFALGMSTEEMIEVLEQSKSNDSKISGKFNGNSSLKITNLKCFGYLFHVCFFTFIDDELDNLSFSIHFDKKNKDPEEFADLLSLLEGDYGKSSKDQALSYIWENEDKTNIMLYKKNEKKKTSITITVMRDIFNAGNQMIYK